MRRRIRRSFVEQAAVLRSLRERLDRRLIERELALLAAEITDHDIMGRWAKADVITGS